MVNKEGRKGEKELHVCDCVEDEGGRRRRERYGEEGEKIERKQKEREEREGKEGGGGRKWRGGELHVCDGIGG